jgi:hypothetical protein
MLNQKESIIIKKLCDGEDQAKAQRYNGVYLKNTKLRSEGVKRARELIYTAERQASCDVSLTGLRPKPGSSHHLPPPKKLVLEQARAGLSLSK